MAGACFARENWEGKQRQGENKVTRKEPRRKIGVGGANAADLF